MKKPAKEIASFFLAGNNDEQKNKLIANRRQPQ